MKTPANPANPELTLLADECVNHKIVKSLRAVGYSVLTAQDFNLAGAVNGTILKKAVEKRFVLLTEDQDFCNLLTYPSHLHCGVIVLKTTRENEPEILKVLLSVLIEMKVEAFDKSLVVVSRRRYRVRREPPNT